MFANYHTHTERCQHAVGEDREYIEHAIMGGLKVLGFSDHCPWIYDSNYVSHTRMLPSQLDEYFNTMSSLKKEYAKDITIYVGFEAEYIPCLMERQNALLKDYPIDYMILGEHFTDDEQYSKYTGFPSTSETELSEYVNLIIEGMETGKYLYVAHPDLFNYVGSEDIYVKHMTRLCEYLKSKSIPIEINLLGVVEHRHYTSARFLKIAKAVGNSAIVGVDAHNPERLSNIQLHKQCEDLANKFGIPLVKSFSNLDYVDIK